MKENCEQSGPSHVTTVVSGAPAGGEVVGVYSLPDFCAVNTSAVFHWGTTDHRFGGESHKGLPWPGVHHAQLPARCGLGPLWSTSLGGILCYFEFPGKQTPRRDLGQVFSLTAKTSVTHVRVTGSDPWLHPAPW